MLLIHVDEYIQSCVLIGFDLCQGCTSKICGILLFKVLKPTHECVNRRFLAYMSTVTLVVLCDSGVA